MCNLSLLETFPWFQKPNGIILTAFFYPKEWKLSWFIPSEIADEMLILELCYQYKKVNKTPSLNLLNFLVVIPPCSVIYSTVD